MAEASRAEPSALGAIRGMSAALLAVSGVAGLYSVFLPWLVYFQPGMYYADPSLFDGLTWVVSGGDLSAAMYAVVPALDLLAIAAAYRMLRGDVPRSWLGAIRALSLACLAVSLLVAQFRSALGLSFPYITPTPAAGLLIGALSFTAMFGVTTFLLARGYRRDS